MVSARWLKILVLLAFFAQSATALAKPCMFSHADHQPVTSSSFDHRHHVFHDDPFHDESADDDDHPPHPDYTAHGHCDETPVIESISHDQNQDKESCCDIGALCPLLNGSSVALLATPMESTPIGFPFVLGAQVILIPDEPVSSLYRPPILR